MEPDAGWGIPLYTTITGTYNVERAFVNKEKFVEKLNEVYVDRDQIKEKGKNSREHCLKNYDWDSVVFPKWNKLLHEVLE